MVPCSCFHEYICLWLTIVGTSMGQLTIWRKVYFNVGGCIYETWNETLKRFPDTLLGDNKRRYQYFDSKNTCFYFNRSRIAFDAILFYYQSNGCLVRPPSLPMRLFEYECIFYDLGDDAIEQMKVREGYDPKKKLYKTKIGKNCFNRLWTFLEYPESSTLAKFYTYLSLTLILFIVAIDCVETVPGVIHNVCKSTTCAQTDQEKAVHILKLSLNVFFAIEYLLRLISSPKKLRFIRSISNLVDLAATFPAIIAYFVSTETLEAVLMTRVLRTFRILRLTRLSKNFRSLSVVLHIISNSLQNLFMLLVCMFISITLFGSMMYYTELGTVGTPFTSIPEGMYFAMQTVVSVGYGDIIPESVLGKVMASATAVIGALTMTLPLLSLGGKYFAVYTKTFNVTFSTHITSKAPDKDDSSTVTELR